jgi:NitT/TauT family transport system substrate-binding protein
MARSGWFRWILGGLAVAALAGCGGAAAPVSPAASAPPASAPAKPAASAAASASAKPAAASAAAKPASSEAAKPAASAAAKPGLTQLKAAYVTVLAFGALYRAIDKGYLADQGIDLDLTVVQSGTNAMAFLGSGQLDAVFGNIGDTFFNAINRGLNLRIVAGITYSPPDPKTTYSAPLVARKDLVDGGAIKTVADLKGKKVAMNTFGGIQEYNITKALEPAGLTVKDIDATILGFPDMPAALKNKAVDAAQPPEPFYTVSLEQGIASLLVPNPAPGTMITGLMYGSKLLAPENERLAKGLIEAVKRASNELQTKEQMDAPDNVAIWAKWSKQSEDSIRKQVPNVFARDLVVDEKSVLDQQAVMLKNGRLDYKQPLPESQIFDTRWAPKK